MVWEAMASKRKESNESEWEERRGRRYYKSYWVQVLLSSKVVLLYQLWVGKSYVWVLETLASDRWEGIVWFACGVKYVYTAQLAWIQRRLRLTLSEPLPTQTNNCILFYIYAHLACVTNLISHYGLASTFFFFFEGRPCFNLKKQKQTKKWFRR